ncbi:Clavaminate synthase-like protein [Hypomontagnella monticulosa]|nr:Clavaminate synthase-like protein [Hypomontagnella monticulosa]
MPSRLGLGLGLRFRTTSSRHFLQPSSALSRFQSTSSVLSSYRGPADESKPGSHGRTDDTRQTKQQPPSLETVVGKIDLGTFRKLAWIPENPLLLRSFHDLPAVKKWFQYDAGTLSPKFAPYMETYEDIIFPYELTIRHTPSSTIESLEIHALANFLEWIHESNKHKTSYLPIIVETVIRSLSNKLGVSKNLSNFQQFEAPLCLITRALQFNLTRIKTSQRIKNLYIAQSNISQLPEPLSQDLPVPDIVKHAGKGDVYNSSIWLGLQPTYTPLHRDPNPNLFCQLVSSKRIRLMTPDRGDDIYARVRRELGSHSNSRIRGAEMMESREREMLHRAVWDDDSINEVVLDPRDALFIPKGWWHSVASSDDDGELNVSANWWFR